MQLYCYVFHKNYIFRLDGWASDLDLTFKTLTNGETDITGASQFEYVICHNF